MATPPYGHPENMPLEISISVVPKPSKSLFMFDNKDNSCWNNQISCKKIKPYELHRSQMNTVLNVVTIVSNYA